MSVQCNFVKYKIPEISYSIVPISGEKHFELNNKVSIMSPKDDPAKPYVVKMQVTIQDKNEDLKCSIDIWGFFQIVLSGENSKEDIDKVLIDTAIPELYSILAKTFKKLSDITQFDSLPLPPVEQFFPN